MSPSWNLTNINRDCTVPSEQLFHERIQQAYVNHDGANKTLLEGIWLENSGMSESGFSAWFIREQKGPPTLSLLGCPELGTSSSIFLA